MTKVCNTCERTLSIQEFGKDKRLASGVASRCKACTKQYMNRWKEAHSDHLKASNRQRYLEQMKPALRAVRLECLMHYGGLTCACPHIDGPCGPKPYEFLAIDHIGGLENKPIGRPKDGNMAGALKKAGYPAGYRVLCHNCNSALGFYKYCPLAIREVVWP